MRSTATVESGSQRGSVETRAWYADGLGSIRVESTTTLAGESPTRLVLELVEPPS